jgi:hypothetical protein
MTFEIPGSDLPLHIERSDQGRLLRLAFGDRVYLDCREPGKFCFDNGFVETREIELPGGMLRHVASQGRAWTESYCWDSKGLLSKVDGVEITYDDEGRVVSCRGNGGCWDYAYSGAQLTVISTPREFRRILRDETGRPLAYSHNGVSVPVAYDNAGRRKSSAVKPQTWHCDDWGRLWTITDSAGHILTTYLWEGRQCIAAIGGGPGAPLAAVYSLDPTGTPVRVITRNAIHHVPRDAFGEGLLQLAGTPALFGGAVADGMVHLPYRRLDPLTGSFDSPDPFNGEQQDPRRASGWTGPLRIELPAAGPYTVCRNNPVSLADPTGAISDLWWAIPSALSWSMQNTIGSLLGLWFGVDLNPIGLIIAAAIGRRPFDLEWVTATNYDMFALRTDGWIASPRAFTYQFFLSETGPAYDSLDDSRLFVPDNTFRPTLYGSLLHFVPEKSPDFVTMGQRFRPNDQGPDWKASTPFALGAEIKPTSGNSEGYMFRATAPGTSGAKAPGWLQFAGSQVTEGTLVWQCEGLADWSRCGGVAEPTFPGSKVPVFPAGGVHFNTIRIASRQQKCTVTELVPGQITLFGSLASTSVLQVPGTGHGLRVNDNILLTDSAGVVEIVTVLNVHESASGTTVTINSSGSRLSTPPIALSGLSGLIGTESLTPVAGSQTLLSVTGSSNDYHPGSTAIRLSRNNAAVGFARVTSLEAKLNLNAPLPATLGNSLSVRPATAPGSFNAKIKSSTSFQVVSGTIPAKGSGLTVGPAATAIPAVVSNVASNVVTVDTSISSIGGAGTNTTWRPLAPSASVGTRSGAPEAGPVLTYTPNVAGTAPTTPFVQVDGVGSAVRRITSVDHDAIVLSQPLPDSLATPYSVDRFTAGTLNVPGITVGAAQTLSFNAPPPPDTRAFEIIQYSSPTVTAGAAIVSSVALSGTTATTTNKTGSPIALQPTKVVIVTPATGPLQVATVQRLRLTVTLDRSLSLSSDGLQAAKLSADPIVYSAVRRDVRKLRVRPISGANRIDMPRFKVGELLQINFSSAKTGGPQTRLAKIDSVSGSTITYSADEPGIIQDDAATITVQRLDASDPGNGSARLAIDGKNIAPNQIEFSVWQASDFSGTPIIAVIDGGTSFPAQVTSADQPLKIELAVGTVAGPVTLSQPPARTAGGLSLRFTSDGTSIQFSDSPLDNAPASGFTVAIPYIDAPATATGKLDNGTVRVPKDHENVNLELDRKKSLTDHELTHTLQSIRLGPWLLSFVPIFVFECLTDFTRAKGPTMSDYAAGTLSGQVLSGPGLQAKDDVQVAQGGRAATITVGAAQDSGFQLSSTARQQLAAVNIQDGAVMVRRSLTPGANNVFKWITAIGQLWTVGFAMNVVTMLGWAGLINLIVQLIGWLSGSAPHGVSGQLQSDKKTVNLDAGSSITGLTANSSVSVKGTSDTGRSQTFIRSVASIDGQTLVLQQEVPLGPDSVEVTLYSLGSAPFGGAYTYFPATVPDTTKPAVMKLGAIGGQSLTLQVRDRLDIRTPSGSSYPTCVAAVNGDEVTVEDQVLVRQNEPNDFTVAKIGADDAHRLEDTIINFFRMGWMNYVNDPWAQITRHFEPSNLPGRITTSSLRYLFSTHSWAAIPFGYWFFDNAVHQTNNKGHLSHMEQEASHNSGDTYSPIGSMHGALAPSDDGTTGQGVIGDVGRYWLTPEGGSRFGSGTNGNFDGSSTGGTPTDFINFGQQDAPGVNLGQFPSLSQGPTTGPTFSATTALPPNSVPRDFYALDKAGNFSSIDPRGWLPVSPRLERSQGIHVAFCRPNAPNQYKVTAGIGGASDGDEAQQAGVSKMTFGLTIADVAATVATVAVSDSTTSTKDTFKLIPFQRAAVNVTPNSNRVYRATPAEPGFIVDFVGSDLQAHATLDIDDVEISRFHHFNVASNSFDSGIAPMHLPDDLDIAVRRIQVQVTNVLQPTVAVGRKTFNGFQATLDQNAAAISTIQAGGSAFLLVPSQVAPLAFSTTTSPLSPSPIDPQFAPAANIPANVQPFLADGGAFQVTFQPNQPPEGTTTVTVTIHVGPDAATSVPITAVIELDPFFTLTGGTSVKKGDKTGITLTSNPSTQLASDTAITGVTVTPHQDTVTVVVNATYSGPAAITILVHDSASPQHFARRTLTVT